MNEDHFPFIQPAAVVVFRVFFFFSHFVYDRMKFHFYNAPFLWA